MSGTIDEPRSTAHRSFVTAAYWSVTGNALARLCIVAGGIATARVMGPSAYGALGAIQTTVGMFGVLAGLGLGTIATKFIAETRNSDTRRAGGILGLTVGLAMISATAVGLALAIAAPWLASGPMANAALTNPLRMASLLIPFSAGVGVAAGALAGFEAFRRNAVATAFGGLATGISVAVGAALAGVAGAVAGLSLASVLTLALSWRMLWLQTLAAGIRVRLSGILELWPTVYRFGIPAVLAASLTGPVSWICTCFILNEPGGYAEVGLYTAAAQWKNAILYVPAALSGAALAFLSRLGAEQNRRHYRQLLLTTVGVNTATALLVAAAVLGFRETIMRTYGAAYGGRTDVLVLTCVTASLAAPVSAIGQVLASKDKMWPGFCLNLLWAIVFAGGTWMLRAQGAAGLAGAEAIAYSVHLLAVSIYSGLVLRPELS